MAPEQASGTRGAVTTISDVYGLGAILYALLTGRAPFRGGSIAETLEQVRESSPTPPSKINPRTPRDLQVICLKCLEKEPGKRYATAAALATDLRRFLDHEPIEARPPRMWEWFVMWVRRRPLLAALSGSQLVVTVLAFIAITAAWLVAVGARDEATRWGVAERRARYRAELLAAANALELNHLDSLREILETSPAEHRNWEWR